MVEKSGHTPGPWQRSGVRQSITDFKGHAVGPDGDPVVIVPYNDKQHSECMANANLIAAAPELLEALKRFDIGYEPIFNPFTRADFEAARAAISKAIGEPHA